MIVAGVWTGVGFSNLKNCRTRIQNFGTGAEWESEKVTRPPLLCLTTTSGITEIKSLKNFDWLLRRP